LLWKTNHLATLALTQLINIQRKSTLIPDQIQENLGVNKIAADVSFRQNGGKLVI
jgi:hypothetical protein